MKGYTTKEVIFIINKIEKNLGVQDWEVESIKIWPLVRLHIWKKLDSIFSENKVNKQNKSFKHLSGVIELLLSLLKNWKYLNYRTTKCEILFITSAEKKHNKINGKWFNTCLDPITHLCEKNNISYQVIEYSNNYETRFPSFTNSKNIQLGLLISNLKAIVKNRFINLTDQTDKNISQIQNLLSEYGINEKIISRSDIARKVSQVTCQEKYFKTLLSKYKPSSVIGSNYYGHEMAMNLACKKNNIRSVDIQHGVQGEYHVAYGSWQDPPRIGYDLLPDLFAVWSAEDKRNIDNWAKHTTRHDSIVIGNPIAEYFKEEVSVENDIKFVREDKINVLITLQMNLGLPRVYSELLDLYEENIFFWIRAHPAMSFEEMELLEKELEHYQNCNFKLATSSILYEILKKMDVHITQNSTVTKEAALLNIPTIVIHESGRDLYMEEIRKGIVSFEDKPKKIVRKIKTVSKVSYKSKGESNINFSKSVLSVLNKNL